MGQAEKLPADVLELLFDELQGTDDGSVGPCGLVCKAWLPHSRSRIFAAITLMERNIQPFLDVAQTSSPSIKDFVRTVRLVIRKDDQFFQGPSENITALGPFPNTRTLSVEADTGACIPTLADLLFPNNFPRLSELSLSLSRSGGMSLFQIFAIITPFPTLETLKLTVDSHGSGFNFMDSSVPEVYQIPTGLHTLHFNMAMSPMFLEMLFELADDGEIKLPVFTTLIMQESWPQERSFLGRYLRSFGHKMQHLRVDCSSDDMFAAPGALRCCTALRSLDIHLHDISKVPWALLVVIKHLNSPGLTAIKIIDHGKQIGRSLARQADEWQKLDQALSEERFAGLKCLSVTVPPASADTLRERMPLCAARGIIDA